MKKVFLFTALMLCFALPAFAGTLRTTGLNQGDLVNYLTDVKDVVNEIQTDHATFITVVTDLKTLVNDIRSKLQGNYVIGVPTLAIGSTTTAVSSAAFDYMIGGKLYTKAAVAAGTAPGNDVVPVNKYGAVALDIGTDGTVDAIEATANATGYDSAVLAAAGLPAAAAGHARMGYVTAMKSDGAFTFGTTDLNVANSTVAYTDGTTLANSIGSAVATSAPATLTNNTALSLTQ